MPYTLKNYRDHTEELIQQMNDSKVDATDEKDLRSANNQREYLIAMLGYLDKMLAYSDKDFNNKRKLANTITHTPKKYFGETLVPDIEGEKSKEFAKLLALYFADFANVQFSEFEIDASKLASKIPFLKIRSIPEQMKHDAMIAAKILENVANYEERSSTVRVTWNQ